MYFFDLPPIRSLKLEEERISVLSQELNIKKSLLEDAEANYHRRLNEEVQRLAYVIVTGCCS